LEPEDARSAVRLFSDGHGGGAIKMFGGEPLLVPHVVRAALEEARDDPKIRWVYLSTNGLGLDTEWIEYLTNYPKGILTISMDGTPEDHRRHRRAVHEDVPDTYDHLMHLRPQLLKMPRVVITQTIAPATAYRAAENFQHLLDLGFWRFNFLPGYYIPWRDNQLEALQRGFADIHTAITDRWSTMERTYVRNLFTWAPTPFFNTGLVVDADRSIHPSNVGLSGALDHLRHQTQIGSLDEPPSAADIEHGARRVNGLLEEALSEKVWSSTHAVDAALSDFCRQLYPHWAQYKRRRDAA
jgi:sulfatase maturation enzyme AslB (radical SAM superfamily)